MAEPKLPRACQPFSETPHTRLLGLLGRFKKGVSVQVAPLPDGNVVFRREVGGQPAPGVWTLDPIEQVGELPHIFPLHVASDGRMLAWHWVKPAERQQAFGIHENGDLICEAEARDNAPYGITGMLAAEHLVVANGHHGLLIYDGTSGELRHTLSTHRKDRFDRFSLHCALLNGGKRLLETDLFSFRIWDLASGELLSEHAGPADFEARQLVVSPDERLFAFTAVRADKWKVGATSLHVWSLEDFTPVTRLEGHPRFVRCPAFIGNGDRLVSAGTERRLKVWSTDDWRCIDTVDISSTRDDLMTLHRLPSGDRFIAAGDRGVAYIWELR